ncbi:MAG: hypothetical protein ABI539_15170 [Acidobacteriota bacterium]
MAEVVVDAKAIGVLAADMIRAKRQLLSRLAERGYQLLRKEVPYRTGNLKKGVGEPEIDYEKLEAMLTVSAARDKTGGGQGKIIGADGKVKKTVDLRPRPAYNYARAVAEGSKARIKPRSARVLIIPVPTAPSGESYLLAGGQIYIFRRSAKGMKANPYHERAAASLENEASAIAEAVLRKFV